MKNIFIEKQNKQNPTNPKKQWVMLKKEKENNFFFSQKTFSKADCSVKGSVEFLTNSSNPAQMALQFHSFWRESCRT